jgi:hypothetical protein
MSYFKKVIQYAALVQKCWLLSVTYAVHEKTLNGRVKYAKTAVTASPNWKTLWTTMKCRYPKEMKKVNWLRVPELTKAGQVHFHAIVGGIESGEVDRCEDGRIVSDKYSRRWRKKDCECWEHRFSRVWYEITGDSFVVDFREVYSPEGAGAYLGKYLEKTMDSGTVRQRLEELGFLRRFTTSRNFPRGSLTMYGTIIGAWTRHYWREGFYADNEVKKGRYADRLLERVGDPIAIRLQEESVEAMKLRKFRRVFNL